MDLVSAVQPTRRFLPAGVDAAEAEAEAEEEPGSSSSDGRSSRFSSASVSYHLFEFSIAVDPVTTMRIEEVLKDLREEMTIVLVTNLVQQARRLADRTAFFLEGACVEIAPTEELFTGEVKDPRTRAYVEGRFG